MKKTAHKSQGTENVPPDYRLENDPRFRRRIEAARASLRVGRGVPLEELEVE